MIARASRTSLRLAAVLLAASAPGLASGQGIKPESSVFLEAVREEDGTKVTEMVDKVGATLINTQDSSTKDTALHIVARRGDLAYVNFLVSRKASVVLTNRNGETALLVAAVGGSSEVVNALAKAGGDVNRADSKGQTPLIHAVLRHNADMVRTLLDLGADPDRKDLLGGFSAREYARQDTRSPGIAQLIDAAPKPVVRRAVSGPKL